jgi:hypothetical protein
LPGRILRARGVACFSFSFELLELNRSMGLNETYC